MHARMSRSLALHMMMAFAACGKIEQNNSRIRRCWGAWLVAFRGNIFLLFVLLDRWYFLLPAIQFNRRDSQMFVLLLFFVRSG